MSTPIAPPPLKGISDDSYVRVVLKGSGALSGKLIHFYDGEGAVKLIRLNKTVIIPEHSVSYVEVQ